MTIETKYNIGDEVWLMYENRAVAAQVISMKVTVEELMFGTIIKNIYYRIKNQHFDREISEHRIYASKEELLKSL